MSGRCMDFRYSTCLQTLCPVHIFGQISRWRPCLEAHHCIHWLIPSRQALVSNKLLWLIIPNYHLGAIMTSSSLKPPQMLAFFFCSPSHALFLFIPITHLFHLLQLFRCVARRALQHRLIDCQWWVKHIRKIQPYPAGVAWFCWFWFSIGYNGWWYFLESHWHELRMSLISIRFRMTIDFWKRSSWSRMTQTDHHQSLSGSQTWLENPL